MLPKLQHALSLYFNSKGITNKQEKDRFTIKLHRNDGQVRSIFRLFRDVHPHSSFVVGKVDLGLDHLLVLPKTIKRNEIDKYCIANLVSEYTQGFTHDDVGLIRISNNSVLVLISPESFFYKGTIKIRRG